MTNYNLEVGPSVCYKAKHESREHLRLNNLRSWASHTTSMTGKLQDMSAALSHRINDFV